MAQDCMQQSGNHKTDQYNNEKPHAGDAKGASRDYPGLEGKYTILEKVGRGAQGTVFKASSKTGEIVAIKIFDFREAESWKEVDLLKREVETLQKLDVQGIPKFIEFIEKEPYSYLVESYIEGSSLKDMIEDGFEPTFDQVVAILSSALKILSQLHTRLHPIIHRDIKPGNLIVNIKGEDIRVWLVDFGTVAANRQRTNASTFAGTAGYVAPEQLFGKATPASDIYGMGMTMVHLISGVAPCDMEMDGLTLKYDKYLPENLPKSFRDMLAEMVAPNPNDRLKDAESVLKKLKSFEPVLRKNTNNAIFASDSKWNMKHNDDVNHSKYNASGPLDIWVNKLNAFNEYSSSEKEEIITECYLRTEQDFDLIVDCVAIILLTEREPGHRISIISLIEMAVERINIEVKNRQHKTPDALELDGAVDKFEGYSRKHRKQILIQLYRKTGRSCEKIITAIHAVQKRIGKDIEMNLLIELTEGELQLSGLQIITASLENTKPSSKTNADYSFNNSNKPKEKLWEDLSFSEQVEGCPELKQPGFTPMEVLELYAEQLSLFEHYSLEERKEIIFKCWVHTREEFLRIVDILKEVLSTPEYAVKRRVSDVVSCAEQRLAQGRAQRISVKLTPDKSELEKWAQAFEGYSMKDKKEILSILYQETGRDCEKIVQAIKYEQDDRLPLNKDILVVNAKRRLLFGPPGSVMMNPSLQPLARTNNEAGTEIIVALENRMNALEAPINYSPFWIIFLSLAVISGSGLGLYYIFMKAGTFWGISGCVLLSSLIIHLILLLFEKESHFLLIFVVAALLVGVIAIFMWNWVAGLFALGFLIFVGSKIAE
ncbi:MAG: serine/threonine protein kinase [Proteobacteria bacterium]|nr:serine/threonine protein kinase [Pseudomonadota bacterium]